jgi:Zn-dependent peptidase ImmA (M78 family)/DNA-binding XRE family transcriptional regulator
MDINILNTIDSRQLGKELQQARKQRGLTQDEAAKIIEVARTTLTAIEKGERRIKAGELLKLAQAYGRSVSDFVRPRPQFEPFQVQFRGPYQSTSEEEQEIEKSKITLAELARNYLELEEITGKPLARRYPVEYEIGHLPVEHAAEDAALAERTRFGLGDEPVPILRDLLEQRIGVRIFYLPFYPSTFSEMYYYDDHVGACIAVNSLHPEERRRLSLAHGYAHFLAHRYKPEALFEDGYQRKPESERFAEQFSIYFLMPIAGLARRFNGIRRATGKVTPADLCTMANHYGVSFEAITRRLEEMKLLPTGTYDKLDRSKFKVQEARQKLGLGDIPARDDKFPLHYQYLAVEAFDRELITEGQFARFLQADRLEARQVAEVLRQRMMSADESLNIDLDLTQSLAA